MSAIDPQNLGRLADDLLGDSVVRDWEVVQQTAHSAVLRSPGLIVKHHGGRSEAFEVERQALEYANRWVPGVTPELMSVSSVHSLLVMSDVGEGRSLADALLGTDAADAVRLLDRYVDAVADIHERTWGGPERPEALHHHRSNSHYALYSSAINQIRDSDSLPGGSLRERALEEVEPLIRLATDSGPTVFTIGDMCPDNQVMTNRGLRLFDLEASGFTHPALDIAYLTIPFPSCWCAWDLPVEVRQKALQRYLHNLSEPEVVELALHEAEVFWTVVYALAFFRGSASPSDRPSGTPLAPTYRQVVAGRVDRTRRNPMIRARFPAFCELLDAFRSRIDELWGETPPLELAPAFVGSKPKGGSPTQSSR